MEKYYLKEGDSMTANSAYAKIGANNVLCFDGWVHDTEYHYNGLAVLEEEDGRLYVEIG